MKTTSVCLGSFCALLALAPLAAADDSAESVFDEEEQVVAATEDTQAAAPRDQILQSAVPWITGSYTGRVGLDWRWSDVWGSTFDLLAPSAYGLGQSSTSVKLGFVARPAADISVAGQVRASYPFVQQITSGTATYTVPDFTVWSLYSKWSWSDRLFFTFGKQSIRWGAGYFFSPADDVFAQSEVDVDDPSAERAGPLALKVQYPIFFNMSSLYLFAVLPRSNDVAALVEMKPQDVAIAGKAELLVGSTELALAGYYQREQRPEVMLMATSGVGSFNFFGEGVVAFPGPRSEAYVEAGAVTWNTIFSSDYRVVDSSSRTLFSATAGAMYTNPDWSFTAVGQYLYNGRGYASISLGDILRAAMDRAPGQPEGEPELSLSSLMSSLGGLGRIGRHYGVLSLSWSSLWDSKWSFSVLALSNLSDLSGYVRPTISLACFNYVTLSGSASFSWGADGTEFADPAGQFAALKAGDPGFVSKPSLSLSFSASMGAASF
jgi:hypothetical protein